MPSVVVIKMVTSIKVGKAASWENCSSVNQKMLIDYEYGESGKHSGYLLLNCVYVGS